MRSLLMLITPRSAHRRAMSRTVGGASTHSSWFLLSGDECQGYGEYGVTYARPLLDCTLLLGRRILSRHAPCFPWENPDTSPANTNATLTRCSDSQMVRVCS